MKTENLIKRINQWLDGDVTYTSAGLLREAVAALASAQAQHEALLIAATSCPHEIDHGRVVLHFDPKQPGHNALNQLGRRLASAQAQQALDAAPKEQPIDIQTAQRQYKQIGFVSQGRKRGSRYCLHQDMDTTPEEIRKTLNRSVTGGPFNVVPVFIREDDAT